MSLPEKRTYLRIFMNGHSNHCEKESHNGVKDSLETEMGDDRKTLGKSIHLNDATPKHHTSKKCTNIK